VRYATACALQLVPTSSTRNIWKILFKRIVT
ncbi:MAG: hypothetical protein ACI8UQ_001698, partial [Bacteroidia bacterium]